MEDSNEKKQGKMDEHNSRNDINREHKLGDEHNVHQLLREQFTTLRGLPHKSES